MDDDPKLASQFDELENLYREMNPQDSADFLAYTRIVAGWGLDDFGGMHMTYDDYKHRFESLSNDELREALLILRNLPIGEIRPDEPISITATDAFGLKVVIRKGDYFYTWQQDCAIRQHGDDFNRPKVAFRNGEQVFPIAGNN